MTQKVVRFGVLGAANIARQFIAAVANSSLVKVTAVASRDVAKGKAFAREVGVARACGSYEELLNDPDIDAVYVPLPNSLHAEWSIRAVEAGKHVLCEKPFSVTADEARAMFAAARAHGVQMVEAYPYMAQPQTAQTTGAAERGRDRRGAANPGDIRLHGRWHQQYPHGGGTWRRRLARCRKLSCQPGAYRRRRTGRTGVGQRAVVQQGVG